MPELYGSVTPSAAAVATAASTALPPSRSTSRPMALADASTDETAPPCPVDVEGAGGVGRPVTTAAVEVADAGAAAAPATRATDATSARPTRRSVERRRRTTLTMGSPRNGYTSRMHSP